MAIPNGTNTPLTIEQRYGKQAQGIGLQNQRYQQGQNSSVLAVLPGNKTIAQQIQTANAKFGSGLAHQEGNRNTGLKTTLTTTPSTSPNIPDSFLTGKKSTSVVSTQSGGKITSQRAELNKQLEAAKAKTQSKPTLQLLGVTKSGSNVKDYSTGLQIADTMTDKGFTNSNNYRPGSFSNEMLSAAKEMTASKDPVTQAVGNLYLLANSGANAYKNLNGISDFLNIQNPNYGTMIAQGVVSSPANYMELIGGATMGAWAYAKTTAENLKHSKSALNILNTFQDNQKIIGESATYISKNIAESATTDPERFTANIIAGMITGGIGGAIMKGIVKGVTSSAVKTVAKSTVSGAKSAVRTTGKSVSAAATKTASGLKNGASAVGKSVSNAAKSASTSVKSAKTTVSTKIETSKARAQYSSGKSHQISPSAATNKNTLTYVQNTSKQQALTLSQISNTVSTRSTKSGFSTQAQKYVSKQPATVQNAIIQAWNSGQNITITSAKKIAQETRKQIRNEQKQLPSGQNKTLKLLEGKTGTTRSANSQKTKTRNSTHGRNLTPSEEKASIIVLKYSSLLPEMKALINKYRHSKSLKTPDIYTKTERKAIEDFNTELNTFLSKLSPDEVTYLSKLYPDGIGGKQVLDEAKAQLKSFTKQKSLTAKLDTELIGILFRKTSGQTGFASKITKEQYNFIKNLSPSEKIYLINEWRHGNKFSFNEAKGLVNYYKSNRDEFIIDSKFIVNEGKPIFTDKEIKSIVDKANEITDFIKSLSSDEIKLINDYFTIDVKSAKTSARHSTSNVNKQTGPGNDNTQGVSVGNQIMAVKTTSKSSQSSPKWTPSKSQISSNKPTTHNTNKSQNQLSATTQKSQTKSQSGTQTKTKAKTSAVSVSVQTKQKSSSKTNKPNTQKQELKQKPKSQKIFVVPPVTVKTDNNTTKTVPAVKIIVEIPSEVLTSAPSLNTETETQTQNAYLESLSKALEDTNKTTSEAKTYAKNYATAYAESYVQSRSQGQNKKQAIKISAAYATTYANKTTSKTGSPLKSKKTTTEKTKTKTIPKIKAPTPSKPKTKSLPTSPKTPKRIVKKTKSPKRRTYYQRINWDEGEQPWITKNLPIMKIPAKH